MARVNIVSPALIRLLLLQITLSTFQGNACWTSTPAIGGVVVSNLSATAASSVDESIISTSVRFGVEKVTYLGFLPVLLLVSMTTNALTVAVTWRQGITQRRRVNLCLFFLSTSDALYALTLTCVSVAKAVTLLQGPEAYSGYVRFILHYHLFRKASIFLFFSSFLTSLVAMERCVCVVWPLRVDRFLRVRTLLVVIALGFSFCVFSFVLVGMKFSPQCSLDPKTNSTVWVEGPSQFYKNNRQFLQVLEVFVLNIGFQGVSILVVVLCTAVTTYQLNASHKWRLKMANVVGLEAAFNDKAARKEAHLNKMLIVTSCVHVMINGPGFALIICAFFINELSAYGRYRNIMYSCIAVRNVFTVTNASVKLFIYYNHGSAFRKELRKLLR